MSYMVYMVVALIVPMVVVLISIPISIYLAQQHNMAFARTHVQVESISDNMPIEVYVCEKPVGGNISIYEKRSKDDKSSNRKERKLLGTMLAMNPHPSAYPFKMWSKIQAPIMGYYANAKTGSFVPLSLGVTDPLEVASQLGSLANEKTTQVVVRESREMARAEDNSKKVLESLKSLPMLLVGNIIATVVIGVLLYYLIRGITGSQSIIINGLRGMGVLP